MRMLRLAYLLALPFCLWTNASAEERMAHDAVTVIGALHQLHTREPEFSYDDLRDAIVAFAPDIVVLEVRPDELAAKKDTPGRPEYPAVIWPLLNQIRVRALAMEPGGATFTDISGEAGAAFRAFAERDPVAAAALSRLEVASDEALLAYWRSPGQAQDSTTASLTAGVQAAQLGLAGPAMADAQARWDRFMTERAIDAVRSNPGKRVLILGSYKNRAMLEQGLRKWQPKRVVSPTTLFGATSDAKSATHSRLKG